MLSARQTRFALEYAVDHNGAAAAARAGYSAKSARDVACRLLRNPEIRELVDQAAKDLAAKLEITRQTALQGILEGVALARAKGDPGGMIRGWCEVARLLGLYPPTERRVRVTTARDRSLRELSDEELGALLTSDMGEGVKGLKGGFHNS
jgi:phage terminase small subunit